VVVFLAQLGPIVLGQVQSASYSSFCKEQLQGGCSTIQQCMHSVVCGWQQAQCVQAPALSFQVPKAYRDVPILTGRARVEFVVEKANGASAFVDSAQGGTYSRSTFEITLDGYSAPVTAGKFAKLVRDGKFDSMQWSSGYLTLVAGRGSDPGATLPLEILPIGVHLPRLPQLAKRLRHWPLPLFSGVCFCPVHVLVCPVCISYDSHVLAVCRRV
jgi:hypothetical protein